MKNTLKLNHEKGQIIMDRTFAKNAENTRSEEYAHLQNVRRDYPHYTVVRRQIKPNPNKECWKGLTYEYMENYIKTHGTEDERKSNLKEYEELRLISECHSKGKRYPTIKKWFLAKYHEVAEFGMAVAENENAAAEEENTSAEDESKILEMPRSDEEAA